MIKGRKVGLRRTWVILLHKKLWPIAEGLRTMSRKNKGRKKRKHVRGSKSRTVRHGRIYHKSVC